MPIKTLIFDLVGVLFYVNKIKALRCLNSKDIILYYLKKGKNPLDEGIKLLDKMRREVSGQFQERVTYKGTYLPQCFLDWNQGFITRAVAFEHIQNYFSTLDTQGYFSNENHKKVIFNLLSMMFSSELAVTTFKPVLSTVELIEKLKKTNKYKLYILSNIDKETFEDIHSLYRVLFDEFDGIVTSCYSHFLKPEVEIFEYLFKEYNLDPLKCCFIDDQRENLETAQKLGMQTIHCVKFSQLPMIFKKKGFV